MKTKVAWKVFAIKRLCGKKMTSATIYDNGNYVFLSVNTIERHAPQNTTILRNTVREAKAVFEKMYPSTIKRRNTWEVVTNNLLESNK
jgi:hypothetical protein